MSKKWLWLAIGVVAGLAFLAGCAPQETSAERERRLAVRAEKWEQAKQERERTAETVATKKPPPPVESAVQQIARRALRAEGRIAITKAEAVALREKWGEEHAALEATDGLLALWDLSEQGGQLRAAKSGDTMTHYASMAIPFDEAKAVTLSLTANTVRPLKVKE